METKLTVSFAKFFAATVIIDLYNFMLKNQMKIFSYSGV